MVKVCIFCNKRVNSDEHVWPEWLLTIIKQWHGKMIFQAMRINRYGKTDTWDRLDPEIRVGNVCRGCNSGWMSRLEGEAKPILIALINGEATTITLEQQTVIATWINKCGLIFDTMATGEGIFYSKADRVQFSQTLMPLEHTNVWIGWYSGPTLRAFTRHGTYARPKFRPPYNLNIITMAFGRLVLQLTNIKFYTSQRGEGFRLPVRNREWDVLVDEMISHRNPGPINWPPSVSFDDTNYTFDEFSDRFRKLL